MQFKTVLSVLSITAMLCFTACGTQGSANSSENIPAQAAESSPAQSVQEESGESADGSPSPAGQEKSAANTPNLSVLSAGIDDLEQRIGNTTPTGSAQAQKEQFLTLKNEINALENELDYTEDTLESQYQGGSLEISQYQEQEREIDSLEDRLDDCEDRLELLFGIDD